jgi:hypothetical protein
VVPGAERAEWEANHVIDAVIQLEPLDDYEGWIAVLAGITGAVELGYLDDETGRTLWIEASSWASEDRQRSNADGRYDPEVLWDREFTAPAEARVGALFARARDNAVDKVESELLGEALSTEGEASCKYLARYHRRRLNDMIEDAQRKLELETDASIA